MIEALHVRCGNGKDIIRPKKKAKSDDEEDRKGCNWEGTLGQWRDEHNKVCPFAIVQCPECRRLFSRKYLGPHKIEDCPSRKAECDVCHSMVAHSDFKWHTNDHCPKALVRCGYCGEEMERAVLGHYWRSFAQQKHPDIDQDIFHQCIGHYAICPKVILNCEFKSSGCEASFRREDAAAHHEANAQYHAALVEQKFKSLQDEMNWEYIGFAWTIPRERIIGRRTITLRSSALSNAHPYKLYLKLILRGPQDPIEVGICCEPLERALLHSEVELKNITISVTDTSISNPYKRANMFLGGETVTTDNDRTFEFRTSITDDYDELVTRTDLLGYLEEDEDTVVIRVSFNIKKIRDQVVGCANLY